MALYEAVAKATDELGKYTGALLTTDLRMDSFDWHRIKRLWWPAYCEPVNKDKYTARLFR